jgi:hypothetical protein
MAFDEILAARIRDALARKKHIEGAQATYRHCGSLCAASAIL